MSLAFISHVFYAFAWPSPDGTVMLSEEVADLDIEVDRTQGCIKALTQLKVQYPQLKIILSIGGAQGSKCFPQIASNNTARMIFASTAKGLVDMYDFDGIDIDWEHPSSTAEGHDYVHLLDTIRTFLPASYYILTSALPAAAWALRHINLAAASSYLNFLNLMAYDYSGPWSRVSGHQSQLYSPPNSNAPSANSAVLYCLQRSVPPSKILLGLPAYGHSFPGTTGPGQACLPPSSPTEERAVEYNALPLPSTTERVDEQLGAAFLVDPVAGFVSYDNAATVRMKAAYVQRMRLGGLFYWQGTGDVRGERSLVETGYNSLHNL
ncbi:hypothetical protein MMC13_007694 [Lambiella insularis]|nr:hypothetical protein [Lambiella insularis]